MKQISDIQLRRAISEVFGKGINKENVFGLCRKLLDDQSGKYANTTTITLRDKFAAEAMGAILSKPHVGDVAKATSKAYKIADAMIEARIKH